MLKRIQKAMQEKEEGFTLIELLVVMIIIGILAAIAIPVFLSQKKKAYETSLKSDLTSIATNIATALVDDPATVGIAAGTGNVVITSVDSASATLGTYTVPLSNGNAFNNDTAVDVSTGTYCVSLKHGTSADAPIWHVLIASAATGQKIGSGAC